MEIMESSDLSGFWSASRSVDRLVSVAAVEQKGKARTGEIMAAPMPSMRSRTKQPCPLMYQIITQSPSASTYSMGNPQCKRSSASPSLIALLFLFGLCGTTPCFTAAAQEKPANADFIASACKTTTFQRLCVDSLAPFARVVGGSPLELCRAALSVSLSGARSAAAAVSKLAADGDLAPRDAAAVRDCVTTTEDSVEELRRSLDAMSNGRSGAAGTRMDDIQTWVSAALTDEDTCMDGFARGERGAGEEVKVAIRREVVRVAQFTSNALALINALNAGYP